MKKKIFTLLTLLVAIVTGAWAEDVTIFSITNINKANVAVDRDGGEYTLTSTDAKIVGGTVLLHNGKASDSTHSSDNLLDSNGQIVLSGSGASYMHVELTGDYTIAAGDILNFGKAGKGYISNTTTKGDERTFESTGYVVPANSSLIGQKHIYFWKPGSGEVKTFTSFTITRPDPSNVVTPSIAFSSNKATITCATANATIRYTLDGTEPTSSSTEYTAAIDLTNSCTVRAKAFKDENESSEASKDCYVDHSAAEGFLTILKFNGGSVGTGDAAKVWTSTDGKYVLTDKNNDQTNKWSNLEGSQDAFKLSHVDGYTLAVPSNVKITKVVFIGKSLYRNYAGTVAMTTAGFTPTNASFIQNENIDNWPMYLSTIEFTNSSLNYGDAIDFNPGGCESAAYIELYGEVNIPTHVASDYTTTYGQTPVSSDDRLYEVYGFSYLNSSSIFICAGSPTTSLMAPNNVGPANKSDIAWITNSISDKNAAYTELDASYKEFSSYPTNPGSAYSMKYKDNKKLTIKISGYDQFSILAKDANTNNPKYLKVTVDGTEVTKEKSTSSDGTIRRYDITTGEHVIVVEGVGDSNNILWGFSLRLPANETITTDNGVATYVTEHALDFTGLETKAYVVTGVNAGKTKVLTEEVTTVPAGTALLVKGATVEVPIVASATAPATNLFLVSDGSVVQNTDKTIFVYSKNDKVFKRLGTATIPNGKCYITIEDVPEATYSLDVDIEGEATAITNVNANENANSAAPVKIIKNGKLYIGNYNVAGQLVK